MVYLDEERAGKRRGREDERGWEMGMRGLEERGEEKRGPPLSNTFHLPVTFSH